MNRDLGLSSYVFGLGAGAFFWGYFLLEVPSNLILERVGARRWIARIMVSWGLVSAGFAFVQGPISFFTLRFLLGLAEAGFFPGMILYFTYWFPPYHRAQGRCRFHGRDSGLDRRRRADLDGVARAERAVRPRRRWKWLFLAEAAPAVIMGIAVLFWMTDRPAEASWLEPEEKRWLSAVMDQERRIVEQIGRVSVLRTLVNPQVLTVAAIHFAQAGVAVGIAVFTALIIKQLGLSNMQTGLLTAVPYVLGTVGILVWGYISDRMNERRWNLAASCFCMAIGFTAAGLTVGTYWSIAGISLGVIGLYASNGHLWPLPSMVLTGAAAASGIAWANSLGILAGSITPPAIGWIKDVTGSFQGGLYLLAAWGLMGAIIAAVCVRETAAKLAPDAVEAAE